MKNKVRVAGGQGFWGDLLTAPAQQVNKKLHTDLKELRFEKRN